MCGSTCFGRLSAHHQEGTTAVGASGFTVGALKLVNKFFIFEVRKPVHYHTIQINQPTRCNSFTSLLLDVYVWLNMFRAPLCPSSGGYNCNRSLWFYRWSVAVGALLVVV